MKGWFVIFSIALLSRCCNSNCPRRHLHSFVCIVHWLSYTKCCLFIFVLSIFVLHLLFTIPSYMFLILLLLSLLSSYFSVSSVPPNFPPTLPSCVINPFWARLFNLNYYLMFTPDPKQNCSHNLEKNPYVNPTHTQIHTHPEPFLHPNPPLRPPTRCHRPAYEGQAK